MSENQTSPPWSYFPDMILRSPPLSANLSAASNPISRKVHLLWGPWSGAKFFIRDIRQASSGLFHFNENHQDLFPKVWHSTDTQRSLRWQLASPSQSNRTNMGHIHHKDEWICLEWMELEPLYKPQNYSIFLAKHKRLGTFWFVRHLESAICLMNCWNLRLRKAISTSTYPQMNQKWKMSLLNFLWSFSMQWRKKHFDLIALWKALTIISKC